MSMKLEDTILQAIDIIANKRIANAGYDKTIQATIVSCVDATIGKYKVKYQDSILFAYSGNTDTTYSKGANVYVLVPGGNMNNDKTILGTTQKLGINYINISEEIDKYRPIGNNVITSFSRIGLTSYRSQQRVKYRNSETVITSPIDINIIAAEEYLSKSKYFAVKCNIQTDLEDVQKGRGDYGIIVKMRFNDNSGEGTVVRNYMLNIDQMAGNPYNFEAKSPQYIVFSIDNQNFIKIQEISFFTKDFPNQNDTYTDNNNADIFFSDFEIQALQAIQEQNLNGYNLIIRQPHGHAFFENDSNSKKIEFVGQVRVKNEIVDLKSQSIDFYWFIENPRITTASEDYNKMYGGQGWKLIQSGSNTLELSKADVITETTKYKCTVSYDGIIFSRQFEVKNFDAEYRLTIESSDGTVFYLDSGNPTLQCICTKKQGTIGNLTYSWSYVDNNGIFRTVTEDNTVFDIVNDGVGNKGVVNIKQITTFMTFKCAVSQTQGGRYLGTAAITLRNILEAKFATYSMVINNASQVFKYNELGVSPVSKQNIKPIEIPTLSFSVYSPEGDIIDSQTIRVNGSIKWRVPKNNTMLNIPNGTPSQTTDDEYIFTNQKELSYTIADRFNFSGTNNTIILQVNYDNTLLVERTNLNFIKEGAAGTNGTDFVCKIVPQVTAGADIPVYPTIYYYDNSNVTKNWNSNYLNVQFWHNGELIFDGNTSGNTEQGMPLTVTWEVLKNYYAGINNNRIEDNTNLEINSTNGLITLKSETISIQDYLNYHPANLIKATVQYQDHTYYGFIPIITVRLFNNSYKVDLKEWSGFIEALYTSSGLYPSFDEHQPFTLEVKQNNADVSLNKTITYEWHLQGSIREKQANGSWLPPKDNTEGKWLSQAYVSESNPLQKNQYKVKPADEYDGECVNTGLSCVVKNNSTIVAWIHIPIHLLRNRYANSAINGWDGNSVELGQDNGGMILAPQVGAGVKQSDNSFTGMFIGTSKDPKQNLSSSNSLGSSNQDVGLFGYSHGNRSVFIDAKTGKATFGVSNQGQIIIDPGQNTAQIKSSNYQPGTNGSGMIIDFAKPQIKFGSGKFSVNENGQVTATAGNISGDLLTSGHIRDKDTQGSNFDLNVETGELNVRRLKITSGGTGARNLILDSATKELSAQSGAVINYSEISVPEWGATNAIHVTGTVGSSRTFALLKADSPAITSILNQNYIHSIYIKNNGSTAISVSNNLSNWERAESNTQQRIILYGIGDSVNSLQIVFSIPQLDFQDSTTTFDFIYWHPQIEKGTIPSDWSIAPEDLQNAINEVDHNWSTWVQSDDGFKASVDERITKTQISGTNLLRGTADMVAGSGGKWQEGCFTTSRNTGNTSFIQLNADIAVKVNGSFVWDSPIPSIKNGVIITGQDTDTGSDHWTGFVQHGVPLAANRALTISCWVKGTAGDKVRFLPWYIPKQEDIGLPKNVSGPYSEYFELEETNKWTFLSFTCQSPTTANLSKNPDDNTKDLSKVPSISAGYVFYYPKTAGNKLICCGLMLEYATLPSGWSASPYDDISSGDNLFINPTNSSTDDGGVWPLYTPNNFQVAIIKLSKNLTPGKKYILTLFGSTPTRTDNLQEQRYYAYWGGGRIRLGYVYMDNGVGSLVFRAPYKTDFKESEQGYIGYDTDSQILQIHIWNGTKTGASGTEYSASITKAKIALVQPLATIISNHSDWIQTADKIQTTVTQKIETIPHINLLPSIYFREYTDGNSYTSGNSGVTWTVNADGTVTAKGTGTAQTDAYYYITGNTIDNDVPVITLDPQKEYTLSGCPTQPSGTTNAYRIVARAFDYKPREGISGTSIDYEDFGSSIIIPKGYKYVYVFLRIKSGTALTSGGVTFSPMFEVGSEKNAYQSTHDGTSALNTVVYKNSDWIQTADSIVSTVSYQIDSKKISNNLLPSIYHYERNYGKSWNNQNTHGLTFTVNSNGSIEVSGTATANTYYYLTGTAETSAVIPLYINSNKEYTLSGCPKNGSSDATNWMLVAKCFPPGTDLATAGSNEGVVWREDHGSNIKINTGYSRVVVYIRVNSGATINKTFWPMLNGGDTKKAYESSHNTVSADISNELVSAQSRIEQTAKDIGLIVQGETGSRTIKRAAIVASINGNNSSVNIEANNINLTGAVTITSLEDSFKSSINSLTKAIIPVYYRSTTNTTPTISSETSIGSGMDQDNIWTYRMPYPKKNCYFFTCNRLQTRDGSFSFSVVRSMGNFNRTATWASANNSVYIDGGAIYAKSVTADQISVNKLEAISSSIAGWTIDSRNIMKEVTLADNHTYLVGLWVPASNISADSQAFYVQDTTANNYPFSVTYNGSLVANKGTIGGWNITSNTLNKSYDATENNAEITHYVQVGGNANANNTAFLARHYPKGDSSNYTNDFYVRWDGYMYSTYGKIAGWEISQEDIHKTVTINSEPHYVYVQAPKSPTASSAAFAVRKGTYGNYTWPFIVRYDGSMTARKATIVGESKIAGWGVGNYYIDKYGDINEDSATDQTQYYAGLYAPNSATSGVKAFMVGKRTFYGSSTKTYSSWTYPFYVTYGGKLHAEGAEIEGTITATNGSISSSLITGKITASQIDATGLNAASATVAGSINTQSITTGNLVVNGQDWLTWVNNSALSKATADGVYVRLGSWKVFSGNDRYITFSNLGGTRFMQMYPAGDGSAFSDPNHSNIRSDILISFTNIQGTSRALTTDGKVVVIY